MIRYLLRLSLPSNIPPFDSKFYLIIHYYKVISSGYLKYFQLFFYG